jgi:hypothetical protein
LRRRRPLAEQPFDPKEFPFAFLEAFGNKETTLKRLRKGAWRSRDIALILQAKFEGRGKYPTKVPTFRFPVALTPLLVR